MTLIIGLKTKDGTLLASDKMLTRGERISEIHHKLHKIKEYPVVVGVAGETPSTQTFLKTFEYAIQKAFKKTPFSLDSLENFLFSKDFKNLGSQTHSSSSRFEAFLLATDKKGEKLYHVAPQIVRENIIWEVAENIPLEGNFSMIGSGTESGASLFLELYFKERKEEPDIASAVRCLSIIYKIVSSYDKSVSSSFEIIHAKKGKFYRLSENDVERLSNSLYGLWNVWLAMVLETFGNVKVSNNLITTVFNDLHREILTQKKPSMEKGDLAVIIDDMFSKQKEIYSPLLKRLKSYKVFENPDKMDQIFKFVEHNRNKIKFILLDRIFKTKSKSIHILKKIKESFPEIEVIVVGRVFKDEDKTEFSAHGANKFILKADFKSPDVLEDLLESEFENFITGKTWRWEILQ